MNDITTIPALAAIVYTVIDIVKTLRGDDERFKRLIPLIACVLGAVCGAVAFFCIPGVMNTENLLVAMILGEWFAKRSTQASSNYGIDKNGRVGMYVEEVNRSWCTSNRANDQRAITIECASDTTPPYTMNDGVYATLIELCTDICKRNGKAIYPVETYRIQTVVKGDTLWEIAVKYLSDGSRYPEIKTLNGLTSNVIYSGWKLKIPN